MRNSAWYTKLWRKKLSELPVKGDEGLAWAKMKDLLDQQMPAGMPVPHPIASPTLIKLLSKLGYLFSAAAVLGTAYFFLEIREPFGSKEQRFEEQKIEEQRFEARKNKEQGSEEQGLEGLKSKEHRSKEQIADVDKIKGQRTGAEEIIDSISRTKKAEKDLSTSKTARLSFTTTSPISEHKRTVSNTKSLKERDMSYSLNPQDGSKLEIPVEKLDPVPALMSLYTQPDDRNGHLNSINSLFVWQKPVPVQTQKSGKKNIKNKRDTNRGKIAALSKDNRAALLNQKKKSSIKNPKLPISTPTYNYGLKSGLNNGFGNNSMYFGIYGAYKLKTRWIVNVGLSLNTLRSISGEYLHASYYRPDSLPAFKIIDKRRLLVLDIPITAEYRLSKAISIKAGPVISLPMLQSGINHSFGTIVDSRDTVYHSKQIDSAINKTVINKVNLGFTGGISIQVRKFNVDVMYQFLKPYKISNELGGYQKKYQTIQFGIGYRFK